MVGERGSSKGGIMIHSRAVNSGFTRRSLIFRRAMSAMATVSIAAAAVCAALPLVLILYLLIRNGSSAISMDFFTAMPAPVGEPGGGMANAIAGTAMLVGVASLIGLPVGVGAGLYLAENATGVLAAVTRFLSDVLNGLPSIVIGIVVWQFLVRPTGHFSALSGGVALALIMIPLVTRATEEVVRLVPSSLREAALALGFPRWRASVTIVLRTAMPGIVTASLLALARVAGETAPLLFTAFGNQFWSLSITEPISALSLQIYNYAISPYEEWHALAWAGALCLISIVLIVSVAARIITRSGR